MESQSFAESPGHFIAKNTPRILCWDASLALCIQLASAQTTGTWTGASGATWNTTATNWTGVSGTPWDSTNGTSPRENDQSNACRLCARDGRRRCAAEKWGMRGRCLFRIHDSPSHAHFWRKH